MNGETHSCNITHDRCGDPAADDVFSIQRKYRKSHDPVVKKAAKADLDKLGFKADVTNTFEEWAAWLHVVSPVYFTHTFKQRYPDDCLSSDVHESIRGVRGDCF